MGLTARSPALLDCKSLSPAMATLLKSPTLKYSRGAKIKVTEEFKVREFHERPRLKTVPLDKPNSVGQLSRRRGESELKEEELQDSPPPPPSLIHYNSCRGLSVLSDDYQELKVRDESEG